MLEIEKWLPHEVEYLKENYQKLGVVKCSNFLRRTGGAVRQKAYKMKLTIPRIVSQWKQLPESRYSKRKESYRDRVFSIIDIEKDRLLSLIAQKVPIGLIAENIGVDIRYLRLYLIHNNINYANKRIEKYPLSKRERRGKSLSDFKKRMSIFDLNYLYDECCICKWSKSSIDFAHIMPWSEGGKFDFDNILPLCPNHHRLYDRKLLDEQELKEIEIHLLLAKKKYKEARENLIDKKPL